MVALRTEGVDRNLNVKKLIGKFQVALRTEGVDRNSLAIANLSAQIGSPSARRAWIEMAMLLEPAREV